MKEDNQLEEVVNAVFEVAMKMLWWFFILGLGIVVLFRFR